ncbi:MAG: cob(I)yrinic acid a,c-diamide adenosyltransferase [Acidimicrobiales bacterium]
MYTRRGDDGTTGLYHGGRVRKDAPRIDACGDVDEAQAALGLARAQGARGSELDGILVAVERDLWVLMSELATAPEHRDALPAIVTREMVTRLEELIDDVTARFEPPKEFVVPGQTVVAAQLDLARTVVRRAERHALVVNVEGSQVGPYLNRLSDLCWTLARWQEDRALPARPAPDEERP